MALARLFGSAALVSICWLLLVFEQELGKGVRGCRMPLGLGGCAQRAHFSRSMWVATCVGMLQWHVWLVAHAASWQQAWSKMHAHNL